MNRLFAMEAFVCIVETGSYTAAARRLRIRQPAVSKAIAQLEESLGVLLLFRSTHVLTPTEAGRHFYEHAKRAIHEIEEAELAARGANGNLSGRLRLSAPVTFARLHIMQHIPAFLEQHPNLEIDMVLDDQNIDLIQAGVDIAFRMGPLPDSLMTARKIREGRRFVIGTRDYFTGAGIPATPADLKNHDAIIYGRQSGGAVWTFRKGASECMVSLRGRFHSNAGEGVREAVLSGLGLTVSSEWMFAPELSSGEVVTVLADWSLPLMDLWLVTPPGRQASTKAKSFASFFEACLGNSKLDHSILE
jgi:DNA-binding transcriptional LysR family regulator